MLSRSCFVLCFIGISIASGSWYDEEDWGLKYPEPKTFVCPSNRPITSVYSDFNHNTSQREWKFGCHWNGPTNLTFTTSWSSHANEFQQHFSFSCNQFDGSHFIFGANVLYDPKLADGRWRFGCGRFPPGYRLVNCTTIPTALSIGKLQEAFKYNAMDNTTFVVGLASQYDIGLKDRMWGLTYCKVGIVQCEKPPQPEGVAVTYDSLEYGSVIKYECQENYTYVLERDGICDNSGLWTLSPPDCQPCGQVPYCQSVLCASFDLNATICLECQNSTADGLELKKTSDFARCEADPVITNSLPETITFDNYDILTLNCNAIGYPKPKVVWLHNSTVVSQGNRVLVLSNGSLVILSTMPSDAGLYVCMAISEGHNLSISVTLNQRTFESPIIVDWTNTLYFPLKQSAELHCMATGYPQPNIIWSKDGEVFQHKGRIRILSNGTLTTLHIRKIKERDAGRYRCTASNKIDWISREALVHVYRQVNTQIPDDPSVMFAPIIEPWNLLVSAFINGQAVLTCNSFGNPKPDIKWSKATPYGNKVIKENDRISLYDNGTLVIKDVDFTDKGQYFCRASNELGVMEKHLLFMVKSSPPLPTTTPTPITKEAVTTTSQPETSETFTVPTNSSAPTTDVNQQTADSHASTLQIYWSLLCTLSAYTVLSLL